MRCHELAELYERAGVPTEAACLLVYVAATNPAQPLPLTDSLAYARQVESRAFEVTP